MSSLLSAPRLRHEMFSLKAALISFCPHGGRRARSLSVSSGLISTDSWQTRLDLNLLNVRFPSQLLTIFSTAAGQVSQQTPAVHPKIRNKWASFIHLDCFAVTCGVLDMSAVETSAFSQIERGHMTLGSCCSKQQKITTWLVGMTCRPCCEQFHVGTVFSLLNYTCHLYHCAERSVHLPSKPVWQCCLMEFSLKLTSTAS